MLNIPAFVVRKGKQLVAEGQTIWREDRMEQVLIGSHAVRPSKDVMLKKRVWDKRRVTHH